MAEKILYYNDEAERDTLLAQEKANGFSVKHDDFLDSDGNPTEKGKGKLTFTDSPLADPKDSGFASRESFVDFLADQAGVDTSLWK